MDASFGMHPRREPLSYCLSVLSVCRSPATENRAAQVPVANSGGVPRHLDFLATWNPQDNVIGNTRGNAKHFDIPNLWHFN